MTQALISISALQKLEWIRDEFTGATGGRCLICGGYKHDIGLHPGEFAGHKSTCELWRAIYCNTSDDVCEICGSDIGHKINCPNGIAFSDVKEKIRYEFYGNDGYCEKCKQPLEGRSCPYCGWDDTRPAQYKWR
jgi:hypothetical protein